MSRVISRSDLVALAILSGTAMFVTAFAARSLSVTIPLLLAGMILNCLMLGRTALSLLPFAPLGFRPASEIIIGFTAMALIMSVACALAPIDAGVAFLLSCGIGVAAFFCRLPKLGSLDCWARTDIFVLLAVCIISMTWSWEAIRAVPNLRETGSFQVWSDYFQRAAWIGRFARVSLHEYHGFYHYASYLPAAAVTALTGVPAIVSGTATYTTLGYVLMGLGSYAVGSTLAERNGGIAAFAALLLIPNAAHYGLHNGFFDFHWLEQIATGGSYATGTALVGIALAVLAYRNHSAPAFWLAVTLLLAVLGLRSQVFLPLVIAGMLLFVLLWRPASRRVHFAGLSAAALAGIVCVLIAEHITRAPHLLGGGRPDPVAFVRSMASLGPFAVSRLIESISQFSLPLMVMIGVIYLLFAASGAMLLAYLIGTVWCVRRGLLPVERFIPLAFVAAFVIILFIPPLQVDDDPMQMQHRQFVLLYAVLAVWSGIFVAKFATVRLGSGAIRLVWTLTCILLPVPSLFSANVQFPGGRERDAGLSWVDNFVGLTVPSDIIEGTDFLRKHSKRTDIIMAATNYFCGPMLAMTERAIWFPEPCEQPVTRQSMTPTRPAPPGSLPDRMSHAPNYEAFVALTQERQIDWFVIYSIESPVKWIAERSVWRSPNFYIIRVGNAGLTSSSTAPAATTEFGAGVG
jgi:hypothetical protein